MVGGRGLAQRSHRAGGGQAKCFCAFPETGHPWGTNGFHSNGPSVYSLFMSWKMFLYRCKVLSDSWDSRGAPQWSLEFTKCFSLSLPPSPPPSLSCTHTLMCLHCVAEIGPFLQLWNAKWLCSYLTILSQIPPHTAVFNMLREQRDRSPHHPKIFLGFSAFTVTAQHCLWDWHGRTFLCELVVFSPSCNLVFKTSILCWLPWLQLNERSPGFKE